MELWGGIECTINRVGERWNSQLRLSGHDRRISDLDLIAALGVTTLRYPVLWEETEPVMGQPPDFAWADERLGALYARNITPIVGLLHHGSGPAYTDLLDERFAARLAAFAARVAERFPWVKYYTPVNEPLTTARFSALYGHWYPHRHDNQAFARALINQCRGIVLAMRSIRIFAPQAALVQTEDLGTTYSTPHMQYQRDFDNTRRWLTWDLLCGKVEVGHPMYPFLIACGISPKELAWFCEYPCPPQVIGINHYVTSDRFLDERTSRYATATCGSNGRESYADVEAVRVSHDGYLGWQVIGEAWRRYRLPMALTEVHLACTREEQLRWFADAWQAAADARNQGCDVRAVTAWSLFGSFNWNSLLTREDGQYEPGVFDVRAPAPRPTALAGLLRGIASGAGAVHPSIGARGWWERPESTLYPSDALPPRRKARRAKPCAASILICGAEGSLGSVLARACAERNLQVRTVGRAELDICDAAAVERLLAELKPWALINAAGYARVDEAERHVARCFRENVSGPQILVAAASQHHLPYLGYSCDLVFDGRGTRPYVESMSASPLNAYGRSKAAMEAAVLSYPATLCVRTAAFFGACEGRDYLSDALYDLAQGKVVFAPGDVTVSPTYLPDLAHASLDLLIDGCTGLVHLTNGGAISWADFARLGASAVRIPTRDVRSSALAERDLPAQRPAFSALASERMQIMPSLEDALARFARDWTERVQPQLEAACR